MEYTICFYLQILINTSTTCFFFIKNSDENTLGNNYKRLCRTSTNCMQK